MSSVARVGKNYRSPSGNVLKSFVLMAAILISFSTVFAVARSAQTDGLTQRLARFSFTGSFRFKPKSLLQQQSPQFHNDHRVVIARLPATNTSVATQSIVTQMPVKVIATGAKQPNQQNEIATKNTDTKLALKIKSRRHLSENTSAGTLSTKSKSGDANALLRHIARQPAPPAAIEISDARTAIAARKPPRDLRDESQALRRPVAKSSTKAQPDQVIAARPIAKENLQRARRSSLGATNLAKTVQTSANNRRSDGSQLAKAAVTSKLPVATSSPPVAADEAVKIAAAAPEKSTSSEQQQAPVTRPALRVTFPPLPTKYRRLKKARRKQRRATKKKVAKAAIVKKKLKPKSKPASNWLSKSPGWAGGAFKTD